MSAPIVDIVLKSYAGDFGFLAYTLRSIHKFGTGFRNVIVIAPKGQTPPTGNLETVWWVNEGMEGYMEQQSIKLHADYFTDAEFILFGDSDTVFTRPFSPADFITNGKPDWLYTPRSTMGEDGDAWRAVTERAIGWNPEHEFMRRHPFCVPRWAFHELRAWFWKAHGMSLERYIASQPYRHFSEFNVMGAFLWRLHHERVYWINTVPDPGVPFVLQHYSWGGLTDEIRAKLEEILR